MKTSIALITILFALNFSFAQFGVNTTDPKATLDVFAKSTNTNVADGIILPRLSLAELNAKTSYSADQTGTAIYITNITGGSTTAATASIGAVGLYFFDGTKWVPTAENTFGDIKSAIQEADHNGWIKLDGRAISTLSAVQQANAIAMGFSGNLPNASNAYLTQNGNTLGTLDGSNSYTLLKENLPNTNFTGTAESAGNHRHTYTLIGSNNYNNGFPEALDFNIPTGTTNRRANSTPNTGYAGAHSHSVTVSSGGSDTPIDKKPQTLSVNMFVYLGN